MPSTITLYLLGVWICVGLFTAIGWGLGLWIIGRITARIP